MPRRNRNTIPRRDLSERERVNARGTQNAVFAQHYPEVARSLDALAGREDAVMERFYGDDLHD